MNNMKSILLVVLFLAATGYGIAQSTLPPLDKSPMDMCYYPVDYPVLKIQHKVRCSIDCTGHLWTASEK